jgi:hypothetical protein
MFEFLKENPIIRNGAISLAVVAGLYLSMKDGPEVDTNFEDDIENTFVSFENKEKRSPANFNKALYKGKAKSINSKAETSALRNQTGIAVGKKRDDYFDSNYPPLDDDNTISAAKSSFLKRDISKPSRGTELEIENNEIEEVDNKVEVNSDSEEEEEEVFIGSLPKDENKFGEEDTSDFTEVSNSNNSDDTNGSSASAVTCSEDKSEGVYSTNFSVTLTCSELSNIKYCLQAGGGCCDPLTTPIDYTAPVAINAGDGAYCLSYYGESLSSGLTTGPKGLSYTLNTTPPGLVSNFPLVNLQSTQLPFLNHTHSTDFGLSNHFYHQINFKANDPIGLGWSCSDMYYDYSILSSPSPLVIQNNYDISVLLVTDQIDQSVDLLELDFGNNFIATIIENRDLNLFSCQIQNVVLDDFYISRFTSTGSSPVVGGVRRTSGAFVAAGHYKTAPFITLSGSSRNIQLTNFSNHNLFHILY